MVSAMNPCWIRITHHRTALTLALAASMATVLPARAQQAGSGPDAFSVPIDRWLISSPFPVGAAAGELPLTGPGEEGVLPDRGREQAGAAWTLVRRDGRPDVPIDSVHPQRESPAIVYAHAYVRLPADRTLRLDWSGLGDTRVGAWVNGRRVRDEAGEPVEAGPDVSIPVRFGAGWNTLLFRATEATGMFGLAARLSDEARGDSIRIQASRPPGEVRTGPSPWVIASSDIGATGSLAWVEEDLYAELGMRATAWSRAPVDTVELRIRGEGLDARGGARWLTPGTPAQLSVWVPLARLDRSLSSPGGLEVELKWADEETRMRVAGRASDARAEPRDRPIALAGWRVRSSPGAGETDRIGPEGPLPTGEGWMLSGEWEVPPALAGALLSLDVRASPAEFRIGGTAARGGETLTLCDPCREGVKIEILGRTTGPWSALPTVVPVTAEEARTP